MREQLQKLNLKQIKTIIRANNLHTKIRLGQKKADLINDVMKLLTYDEGLKKFKIKNPVVNSSIPEPKTKSKPQSKPQPKPKPQPKTQPQFKPSKNSLISTATINADKLLKTNKKQQEEMDKSRKKAEDLRQNAKKLREKDFKKLSPIAKKNSVLLGDNFVNMRKRDGGVIIRKILKDMKGDKDFYNYNKILIEGLTDKYKKLITDMKK